jgi:hypothetical protein
VLFFVGTLKVSLKPHNPHGGELPVEADLTTTDEPAWVHFIAASKAGNGGKEGDACYERILKVTRGDVEVGFKSAESDTGIHASVPTGPVIDGRGRRRCRLDGYISRESGTAPERMKAAPNRQAVRLLIRIPRGQPK